MINLAQQTRPEDHKIGSLFDYVMHDINNLCYGPHKIVTVTPNIEDAAFNIFKRYADKHFSFTDCTSFSMMRSLKLKEAFAFDKHFEQFEGISKLP